MAAFALKETFQGRLTGRGHCAPSDRAAGTGLLHEAFEIQADRCPTAPAVLTDKERITYEGLERRANQLAGLLRRNGISRGDTVAMVLPPSADAYASVLGILKSGAAYVPIDPASPADRARFIATDAACRAAITTEELSQRLEGFNGVPILVDRDAQTIRSMNGERLPSSALGPTGSDLCYIIYTSGTTGRPKGVMVEHRNAAHLVCAERGIYGVRASDRVYQGASLSFDLSVEEVWIALAAGAAIVPATSELAIAGPDLSMLLARRGVTVLSCVPTLLSLLDQDVPTLRLVILGGETCPPELVRRWATSRRRLVNTYGPTEATVIATYKYLRPGEEVSLGEPIPGCTIDLLDGQMRRVRPGEVGEICIGGEGVARGYVGLPELTAERFVSDPYAPAGSIGRRLYRSGDLGRLDSRGRLHFCGRMDTQVKIRGYRIELGEIEAAMMEEHSVRAAACAVHGDNGSPGRIIGYAVPRDPASIDAAGLRSALSARLPPYMVPSHIEILDELPLLPSGKLDRAALPEPREDAPAQQPAGEAPRTHGERALAAIWANIFQRRSVTRDEDFFLDLGGHSLLAARMVSEARRIPSFARISVPDVYRYPTVARLAAALDQPIPIPPRKPPGAPEAKPPRTARRERVRLMFCGLAQALGLYPVFAARAAEWVTPYLVFFLTSAAGAKPLMAVVWAAVSALAVPYGMILAALLGKWFLVGRIKPGRHPLWGWWYVRWWLAQTLVRSAPLDRLTGTPLLPLVYRLFGAHMARDVHLETDKLAAFDLITIGSGTSVDEDAVIQGYTVEDGQIALEPIVVGKRCYIGARSVVCGRTRMEDGARLEDLTMLPSGAHVPYGQTWAGSPARPCSSARKKQPPAAEGRSGTVLVTALYGVLVTLLPLLSLAPLVPGVALLLHLGLFERPLAYLAAVVPAGISFVVLLALEVVALKWVLLGRVKPGVYPVHGSFYVRNWIVERMRSLSLEVAGQLHATLYLAPWYRALGARLGKFVELSTASSVSPDLLEIADGGTVADEVSLGVPHVEGGWITVAPTRMGRRSFIGNSAVIPAGTTLGEGSLVGVLSTVPSGGAEQPRTAWLGSPPLLLPRRQASYPFPESQTYAPPLKLRVARAAIELFRVSLPPAGFIVVSAAVLVSALAVVQALGLGAALALLPLIYCAGCAAVLLGVAAAKWCIVGRFRPFAHPLWSTAVWRLELVNALYEFLATPLALEALQGTLFLAPYLRMLGAHIGKGVYLHTTGFLEFDLVELGDRCAVNEAVILQTHLFEDRVLKASTVRVGPDCVLGACSVVLYDTQLEGDLRVEALSLIMKGETLPSGTAWLGIPAAWAQAPTSTDRSWSA